MNLSAQNETIRSLVFVTFFAVGIVIPSNVVLIERAHAVLRGEKNPGCETLHSMMQALKLQRLVLNDSESREVFQSIKEAQNVLCVSKSSLGADLYYSNGRVATYEGGQEGADWYYPNGRVITYEAGQKGGDWYFSNGRVFTYEAEQVGGDLYYSNGRVMTYEADQAGGDWYYPNGRVITYEAGQKSGDWYYPNGRVLTYDAGVVGGDWYYSNGRVQTYDGPEISEKDLMNVPYILFQFSNIEEGEEGGSSPAVDKILNSYSSLNDADKTSVKAVVCK